MAPLHVQAQAFKQVILPQAFCFTKGERVYVREGGSARTVEWTSAKELSSPALSPSGTSIAFTLSAPSRHQPSGSRYIAVMDAPATTPRIVYGTPDHHCGAPTWSPDGEAIAFNNLRNGTWGISVVNKDGSGARDVLFPGESSSWIHVVSWAKDGRSIYGIDFRFLYQVSLDGELMKKTPVKALNLDVISSSGYYSLSPEGDRLLLGIPSEFPDVEDEGYPGSVIFLLDFNSGKARRITPEGMAASQPSWLPDGQSFLFRAAGKKIKQGIHKLNLASGKPELILANGSHPSSAQR